MIKITEKDVLKELITLNGFENRTAHFLDRWMQDYDNKKYEKAFVEAYKNEWNQFCKRKCSTCLPKVKVL